jgi:hypothetical protein
LMKKKLKLTKQKRNKQKSSIREVFCFIFHETQISHNNNKQQTNKITCFVRAIVQIEFVFACEAVFC